MLCKVLPAKLDGASPRTNGREEKPGPKLTQVTPGLRRLRQEDGPGLHGQFSEAVSQ